MAKDTEAKQTKAQEQSKYWSDIAAAASAAGDQKYGNKATKKAGKWNDRLAGFGGDPYSVGDWNALDATAQDQMMASYAATGSKRANLAEIYERQAGEREDANRREEALGGIESFKGEYQNDPRRSQVWGMIQKQLADPDALSEAFRLMEGDIRSESNARARGFEERARENLGSRGMPGNPFLSGQGLRMIGGFEGDRERALTEALRRNRVAEILANMDYQNQAQGAASAFLNNEYGNLFGLEGLRAGITSKTPFTIMPGAYQDFAQYLAALEASKGGGGSMSGIMSLVGGAAGATGNIIPTL